MVGFSKKKKSSKQRGLREHGRGKKGGRGAGLRGGRGNAGAHKHKRVLYESKLYPDGYFGREKGFKRPEAVLDAKLVVNVGEIDEHLDRWLADGKASQEGDVVKVDLTAAGIDKLLGAGQVRRKFEITVAEATPGAVGKIEEAGGSVTIGAAAPEASA